MFQETVIAIDFMSKNINLQESVHTSLFVNVKKPGKWKVYLATSK